MIFLAKFQGELSPVVLEVVAEADGQDMPFLALVAAERIEREVGVRPLTCQEVPPGLLFCEVKFETPEDEEDNSADLATEGVALEPFAEFAEWLDVAEAADLAALAPTEPPAEEGSTDA